MPVPKRLSDRASINTDFSPGIQRMIAETRKEVPCQACKPRPNGLIDNYCLHLNTQYVSSTEMQ